MLGTLIKKEFLNHLYSFRFMVSSALCVVLILLSVWVLKGDYERKVQEYRANTQAFRQELEEYDQAFELQFAGINVARPVNPMEIFYTGLKKSPEDRGNVLAFFKPNFSRDLFFDPIQPLFPVIDLLFVVAIVMSFLAFVLSYDAVCGERETGTLKLLMSYSIPRDMVILAKWVGGFLGVIVPYLIAMLLAVLYILASYRAVRFTGTEWLSMLITVAVSLVFIAAMYSIGVFVSVISRRSNSSIAVLLFVWVLMVLVAPNVSPYVVDQINPIDSPSKVQGEIRMTIGEMTAQFFRDMEDAAWAIAGVQDAAPQQQQQMTAADQRTRIEQAEVGRHDTRRSDDPAAIAARDAGATQAEIDQAMQMIPDNWESMSCDNIVAQFGNEVRGRLPMELSDQDMIALCRDNRDMIIAQLRPVIEEMQQQAAAPSAPTGRQAPAPSAQPAPAPAPLTREEKWQETGKWAFASDENREIAKDFLKDQMTRLADFTSETSDVSRRISRDYDRRVKRQLDTARNLSRISPVASLVYAVTEIAGTGIEADRHLHERLDAYQMDFNAFMREMTLPEDAGGGGFFPKTKEYSPDEVPLFKYSHQQVDRRLNYAMLDVFLLAAWVIVFFMLSFLAFLRMDVID